MPRTQTTQPKAKRRARPKKRSPVLTREQARELVVMELGLIAAQVRERPDPMKRFLKCRRLCRASVAIVRATQMNDRGPAAEPLRPPPFLPPPPM